MKQITDIYMKQIIAHLHICKSANISYDKMRTINKLIIEIYLSPTQKKINF